MRRLAQLIASSHLRSPPSFVACGFAKRGLVGGGRFSVFDAFDSDVTLDRDAAPSTRQATSSAKADRATSSPTVPDPAVLRSEGSGPRLQVRASSSTTAARSSSARASAKTARKCVNPCVDTLGARHEQRVCDFYFGRRWIRRTRRWALCFARPSSSTSGKTGEAGRGSKWSLGGGAVFEYGSLANFARHSARQKGRNITYAAVRSDGGVAEGIR